MTRLLLWGALLCMSAQSQWINCAGTSNPTCTTSPVGIGSSASLGTNLVVTGPGFDTMDIKGTLPNQAGGLYLSNSTPRTLAIEVVGSTTASTPLNDQAILYGRDSLSKINIGSSRYSPQTTFDLSTGNVGVGTTTPGNPLSVNGVINAGGNYSNCVSYNLNGTPAHGLKIKTNLPFQNSGEMPTIVIEGYNYGARQTIGLTISFYIYNNTFATYATASSFGSYVPHLQLSNENGNVVIFIDDKPYFPRFTVRAFAQGLGSEQAQYFNNWSVVDESLNSGDNPVDLLVQNTTSYLGLANRSLGGPASAIFSSYTYANGEIYFQPGGANGPVFSPNGGVTIGGLSGNPPVNGAMINGSVGIGVQPAAGTKLAVNGVVKASEVVVTNTPGADYVFDEDYRLASLKDIEDYVSSNHHLPGIPSAREMQDSGVSLAELQMKLLAKIEELTIRAIDAEKKNHQLETEINAIKATLSSLVSDKTQ